MITWLNPAALVALAAAVLPIVIHLLLRNRATRVRVPSIRFMVQTRESAVRLHRPANLLLLLIRIAVLVCAAIALAAPLVMIEARKAQWPDRTRRAVVVDISASVDASAAADAAAAQLSGAPSAQRFDVADLAVGIERASAWLRHALPGRLELVIVSDFQAGAATAASLSGVPPEAAIRTVTVPRRAAVGGGIDGGVVRYGPRRYAQHITLDGDGTSSVLRQTGAADDAEFLKGASTSPDISSLAKTLAAAGIFAPPAGLPAVVAFTSPGRAPATTDPAAIIVEAPPESLQAAMAVHDVLTARRDLPRVMEFEPQMIPPTTIASWSREPAGNGTRGWERFDSSDARWFWLASIALLGVETLIRRDRIPAPVERSNAALALGRHHPAAAADGPATPHETAGVRGVDHRSGRVLRHPGRLSTDARSWVAGLDVGFTDRRGRRLDGVFARPRRQNTCRSCRCGRTSPVRVSQRRHYR